MDYGKFLILEKKAVGANSERLFEEMDYLYQFVRFLAPKEEMLLSKVGDEIEQTIKENPFISQRDLLRFETELSPLGTQVKKFTIICVAHAHMDINWEWGFDETVSMVSSTIETMLTLMDEYPSFTFGQSTGFVYDILAHYRPDLLTRIKNRIKDGRWEVIASSYVEEDKNLPNGESQIGQLLFTKTHLASLLGISKEEINLDFEPDTFGHSEYVPEILKAGGVDFLYHCRGTLQEGFYRWKSPDGSEILAYRDPLWYHGPIASHVFDFFPSFSKRTGYKKILFVYGVGDHGGGASRRDIENILKYSSYPLFPTIKFGSYKEFFSYGKTLQNLPEIHEEQDQIYTGCYTTNSDIKEGNARVETLLHDTGVFTSIYGKPLSLDEAKTPLYVNQFHDILPGSAVRDSYRYSQGKYQEASAFLNCGKELALKQFSQQINTKLLGVSSQTSKTDTSFGAGVGFSSANLSASAILSNGPDRLFAVFNPSNFARTEIIRLPVWDYEGDISKIIVEDDRNNILPSQLINREPEEFYRHSHNDFFVEVSLDPLSYLCLRLFPKKEEVTAPILKGWDEPRFEEPSHDFVLENENIKAVFDRRSFRLTSLFDKQQKKETISKPSGFFMAQEDETHGMTSWYVERYRSVEEMEKEPHLLNETKGSVYSSITYSFVFRKSKYEVTASLEKDSSVLRYRVKTYFDEKGNHADGVPNFQYRLFPAEAICQLHCDVPLGEKVRAPKDLDIPCSSYVAVESVGLLAKAKHGFRGYNDYLGVSLLRGSFIPMPDVDYGEHVLDFAVMIPQKILGFAGISEQYRHPITAVTLGVHEGNVPTRGQPLSISNNVNIVSMEHKENGIFICLKNPLDKMTEALISAPQTLSVEISDGFGSVQEAKKPEKLERIEIKPQGVAFIILNPSHEN